ncbi:MAG: SDR family NAD(P)-dependent oxidoreductase [Mariprofundus sp.]|nr:SDR family NAD(P)-dependent oxidoreductase [Mariprofundus sp.]
MNILITGANRGLGLGFVHHYLAQGHNIWACYRTDPGALAEIDSSRLYTVVWDISSDAEPVGGLPDSIDLLINNAGIYGPGKDGQSLDKVSSIAMIDVFNVDCVGPLRVVQKLKEKVIEAQGTIANVSSKMGSSGDNGSGGTYAYRAAKAGLVIVSKSMAVDLEPYGVQVITLHPGWVQTDMTHQTGLIDVTESVNGMAQVIAHAHDFMGGEFIAFDGKLVAY